jgi:hypothetical protein
LGHGAAGRNNNFSSAYTSNSLIPEILCFMEVMEQVDSEERRILMALSQVYQEWEQLPGLQSYAQE